MGSHLLVFSCAERYGALPIATVERVIRAVEISPLPESPPLLLGMFDLQGTVTPVIALRKLLSLPDKAVALEDVLIVVRIRGQQAAFLVDGVEGVFECPVEHAVASETLFPESIVTDMVRWEGNLVPVVEVGELVGHEIHEHLHHVEQEQRVQHASG